MIEATAEQHTIIAASRDTSFNLTINAFAGTGKSTTLRMIERAVKAKPILYLAFGKAIAKAIEYDPKAKLEVAAKRMSSTTTVRTMNSLGHRMWAQYTNGNLTLDFKKSSNILREVINELPRKDQGPLWECFWEVINGVGLAKALGYVPEGKFETAKRLIGQNAFHARLEERPDDLVSDLIDLVLTRSITASFKRIIDFNDQVYMPAIFGANYPQFPLVLVDEAQDLNPVNHEMLRRLAKHRIMLVGDPNQCHPPGTKVKISGLGDMDIEKVSTGMKVSYFSTREGRFVGLTHQGREIENVHVENFNGDLITVKVNGKEMKVTPNHKCVSRISRDATGVLLYLMRKGAQYRIGISKIRSEGRDSEIPFGPSGRARQEKADAMWLLDVYDSEIQARAYEHYYSCTFGVPTCLFESTTQSEFLEIFWDLIGDNTDKAISLMSIFGRDVKYPFWQVGAPNILGFHRTGIVHATNLIPEVMTMLTFPDGGWHEIEIERQPYSGPVYGITVAQREESKRVYLANDILVHNSIYGFRGAVQSGMESLSTMHKTSPLDLSISFRCPSAIVANARWRVPNFKSIREGGTVEHLEDASFDSFPDGCAILCRNNAPLFRLAMQFLAAGRSVSVAGSDIGPKLVANMRKLGHEELTKPQVLSAIDDWEAERIAKGSETARDLADCMRVFASHGTSLSSAIAYAEHLFKQTGTIQLMTGHKAKGLEFETVYILDKHLIRMDDEQDQNLLYVMSTRSMENLFYINSGDIHD